ncbi:hypothetical protein FND50_17090 [Rhodococcus sp. WB9]|uniref:hypothetical protein n=1 Tax=Rhodococcus sp. WB9 TaxID=2594007 RepID=UPI00118595BC|nr:hypothetical protein [Rhodococcus sp. WB9]QDQ92362.1 hypothetical protein FND50_17090 [Rhodococcus sp. WB9]
MFAARCAATDRSRRADDVAEVLTLLGDPTVTIEPVVAPAGVGKTAVAAAVPQELVASATTRRC